MPLRYTLLIFDLTLRLKVLIVVMLQHMIPLHSSNVVSLARRSKNSASAGVKLQYSRKWFNSGTV